MPMKGCRITVESINWGIANYSAYKNSEPTLILASISLVNANCASCTNGSENKEMGSKLDNSVCACRLRRDSINITSG